MCLAMCLKFPEFEAGCAYELYAYKKKTCTSEFLRSWTMARFYGWMGPFLVIWFFLRCYYSSIEAGTLKISETQQHLFLVTMTYICKMTSLQLLTHVQSTANPTIMTPEPKTVSKPSFARICASLLTV